MSQRVWSYSLVQRVSSEEAGIRRVELAPDVSDIHGALAGCELGIYTAFRTYGGDRLFGLEEHLDRTDQSMRLSGWSERLDRLRVRRALQAALDDYRQGEDDASVRIDVLAPAGHGAADAQGVAAERASSRPRAADTGLEGRMRITLAPFAPVPARYREQGVRVNLASDLHRHHPLIKYARFAQERHPYPLRQEACYEHLLLGPHREVLEATAANVFARIEDRLWTPAEGILEGITRRFLIACCAELGIPSACQLLPFEQLLAADEAFLSNSTQGILPIVQVLEQPIGDGRPGPWTQTLQTALAQRIELAAERAWPVGNRATSPEIPAESR